MQKTGPIYLDSSNIMDFLKEYDNFLIDCDGVLWSTDFRPLHAVSPAIKQLLSMEKKLFYVTNNPIGSNEAFLKKLNKVCGYNVPPEHLFRVGRAIAYYVKQVMKLDHGKVYVLAEEGVTDDLDKQGINYIGSGPDLDPISSDREDLLKINMDDEVKGVIVAFDKYFSYNKLFKAVSYLSRPDCFYLLGSDKDVVVHLAPGYSQPVTGAIAAAVSSAVNRSPTVIGKPERFLYDCILSEFPKLDPLKTIMIGDSLKTDIAFAHKCGLDSLLVLTGVSSLHDIKAAQESTDPTACDGLPKYITESFSDFGSFKI